MKKAITLLVISFLAAAALLLHSCGGGTGEADVSGIELELTISRFEKELPATDRSNPAPSLAGLRKKYGLFYDLYMARIIRAGNPGDTSHVTGVMLFLGDREIQEVHRDCEKEFSDISAINEELESAFRHYKYYFPGKPVPRAVSFVSGFNYGIISADSVIGIGLDMYLGKEYPYYKQLGYPQYKSTRMRKEYIVADCMRGWGQSEFLEDINKNDFLSKMIYHGKIQYFLDRMMPDAPDTIKWGFTEEQLKWCKENEATMWAFFIEKKLLYNVNSFDFFRYIEDGPTTNGFPKESPARTGAFIGWKIVEQYMNKNPGITLEQLMNDNDAQKILNQSKYKP